MGQPPIPIPPKPPKPPNPNKPPNFHTLAWTAPHAMGILLCDGYLCCERGSWKGFPYLMTTRPLRQASRKWYQDHCKRIKRDGVTFFAGTVGIWQPPDQVMPVQTRAAPRKAATKKPGHLRPGR